MELNIKTIAKLAGVSVPTVSQVLNATGRISPGTREKVFKVCEEHNYRPKSSARLLRKQEQTTITFLQCDKMYSSNYPAGLLSAVSREAAAQGYSLHIAMLPDEKITDDKFLPDYLKEEHSAGLLINYNIDIPEKFISFIERYNIPAVWLNSKQKQNGVYPDDYSGGKMAVEHLIKLNHEKILYVDFANGLSTDNCHYSAKDRYAGYVDAMLDAGLKPKLCNVWTRNQNLQKETVRDILKSPDRPTAVLNYGGDSLWAFAFIGCNEFQLKIPEDLSLITFESNNSDSNFLNYSTVNFDAEKEGAKAFQMLLNKIKNPRKNFPSEVIPFAVKKGNTCAKI